MSKIRHLINKIVNDGNQEYMECLTDMLVELIEDTDKEKEYRNSLYGMAYNYTFNKELAEDIVKNMKPIGEMWSYDTVNQVKTQYRLVDIDLNDLYIVMNSLANDYGEIISTEDVDTYIKMAKAFIHDEDAVKDKMWIYYTEIPKGE